MYSKLKRLCAYDQKKLEPVIVESLKHLSDDKQAEEIAKQKMNDLNAIDLEQAVKIIAGSARSMGIEVKE